MAQIISPNTQNGSVIVKAKLIPPQAGNSGKLLSTTGNTLRWIAPSTVTPAAFTETDDTNITLTLTGTPATSLLQAVNIAAGWTGTLADGRIASAATWNAKISDDLTILAYQALGSSVKAMAVGMSFDRLSQAVPMVDQNEMYVAVYLATDQTITGVKWYHGTTGNYTANNYNGVGLYTYSGGTMTLVASSTNDGNIWKGTANTIQTKAFSAPYVATAGIYFVAAMWCRSAVVAIPSVYGASATATLAAGAFDFTNSAKTYSFKTFGTSLPASRLQSATTGSNSNPFFALY